MSELFRSKEDEEMALPLPDEGSLWLRVAHHPWQPCGGGGFWIKPLMEERGGENRSWLMKFDPGAYSPPHAHDEMEQIYVLEGSFYDEERTYLPGDYIVRAPGAMHEAGSEKGALVLVVYSPH